MVLSFAHPLIPLRAGVSPLSKSTALGFVSSDACLGCYLLSPPVEPVDLAQFYRTVRALQCPEKPLLHVCLCAGLYVSYLTGLKYRMLALYSGHLPYSRQVLALYSRAFAIKGLLLYAGYRYET